MSDYPRYLGNGHIDNGPSPGHPRPELPSPPPAAPKNKKVSQIKIVSGSFYQLDSLINRHLNEGWKLRGRVRKKIGDTYYQVMYK